MSVKKDGGGAATERQRRMDELARQPGFLESVDELMAECDLEIFEEEWMAVTIVNRAKELVLAREMGEIRPSAAREEMVAFYERKRGFFLDETADGTDDSLGDVARELLGGDDEGPDDEGSAAR